MRKSYAVAKYGTQQALAEALGVSPTNLCDWGEVVPLKWAAILALSDRRMKVELSLYKDLPPCLERRS